MHEYGKKREKETEGMKRKGNERTVPSSPFKRQIKV